MNHDEFLSSLTSHKKLIDKFNKKYSEIPEEIRNMKPKELNWGDVLRDLEKQGITINEVLDEFNKLYIEKMNYTMKCVIIGKSAKALYNRLSNISELELLTVNVTEADVWENVNIGFIVADITDGNALEELNKIRENANKKVDLLVPIILSENKSKGKFLNISPSSFGNKEEMYDYIDNAIKSISESISIYGWSKMDMENAKRVLEMSSCWDFVYAEGTWDELLETTKKALNKATLEISDIKSAIYNITASEENLDDIYKIEEMRDFLEWEYYSIPHLTLSTTVKNTLGDNIKVLFWLTM